MNRQSTFAVTLPAMILVTLLCASCQTVQDPLPETELDQLAAWMSGTFVANTPSGTQASGTAATRAAADGGDVLHVVPIWVGRHDVKPDERWLYFELTGAEASKAPDRQRVYRIGHGPNGTIRCDLYELPDPPSTYAGAWRGAHPLSELAPIELFPREGCTVFMVRTGGAFVGSIEGDGCLDTTDGATYMTTEMVVSPDMIQVWDRGFDSRGQQVWGPREGATVFRRTS